jgi:L-threonylcarbamoyladenylate synthase
MDTSYLRVNPLAPEAAIIASAAEIIKMCGTVAFPTETVYGLGANGLDPSAVERIYKAKGRPHRNPLILHVCCLEQAVELVTNWPPEADLLAAHFLPGPLTIILPRAKIVPDIITAGLPSVALRWPDNRVALALIEASGVPIAAPSANLSGNPSPTCAAHVRSDLDGCIDMILDGGPTSVGVESTIISLAGEKPVLLRPGGVTREQLEAVLRQKVTVHQAILDARPSSAAQEAAPCPGLFFKHYAPRAVAYMVTGEPAEQQRKITDYLFAHPGQIVAVLGTAENASSYQKAGIKTAYMEILGARERPEEITSHLFGALRRSDQAGAEIILVETIPLKGIGLAFMNRLCRATENRAV